MPSIGTRCIELRIRDKTTEWRIFCRVDPDALLMVHVLAKKTRQTPASTVTVCRDRLKAYDRLTKG